MARESEIDASIPADNAKVDKADLRANFRTAQEEITQLLRENGIPWRIATGVLSLGSDD